MYASLARFGYKIAKNLRPGKIKKKIKPSVDKLKSKLPAGKASNLASGATDKIGKGYRSAYAATLGSSTKRKVTSAVLGTSFINDILDD
jgi:hypothetical protein|tara:strand:+ start:144 stop:410 length:267 start_codon:yes stop_codon:yes gene_type:complete